MERITEPENSSDLSDSGISAAIEKEELENRARFFARLEGLPPEAIEKIKIAYKLSKDAHRPQTREAGERYFEHPREVALVLIDECGITDPDLIVAALLHDTVEDTDMFAPATLPYQELAQKAFSNISAAFNPEVAQMIIAVTKPKTDGIQIKTKEDAFDLYINGLAAASPKTLLVKMADRLHNLRTLGATSPEKQKRKLAETKEIYLPIFKGVLQEFPVEGQHLLDEMEKAIAALEIA